jgi:SAM-dependent methyltransferase
MCNNACIEFGRKYLTAKDVAGKRVIEVGAHDINGSLRLTVEPLRPESYTGVDIDEGPGVDRICNIHDLADRFGKESFDIVIATEILEHIRHWRNAITNMKTILKPGGIVLITTRSAGFGYHGYPFDFWRYEVNDMKEMFGDMAIEALETDPLAPGVLLKARKPSGFKECRLDSCKLYSIIKQKRCRTISAVDILIFNIKWKLRELVSKCVPQPVKNVIKRIFGLQ